MISRPGLWVANNTMESDISNYGLKDRRIIMMWL